MKNRGFALTELIVIIGMVVLVMACLFPAIQRSREDARQMHCRNNLKQIGLALHNYHDTMSALPPGWVSKDGYSSPGTRFGWQAFVLPFLDQAPLYNRLEFQKPVQDPDGKPNKLLQTAIPSLRCPADPTPNLNPLRGNYGTSNYSANYGDVPARLRPLGLTDFWPGQIEPPMSSRGICARNSSVRFRDITDGLSNTLFVGERGFKSGSAIWVGVTGNTHDDDAVTDSSHRSRPNAGFSSYSSRHQDEVNVLMGDGSARVLKDSIESLPAPDMGIFQKLACKNDGQPIGDF